MESIQRLFRSVQAQKLWEQTNRPAEFSNLEITDFLGGNRSPVYKAVDRSTGAIYALKVFTCCLSDQREEIKREIQVLKQLHHPNLVKIHELFQVVSDQKKSLVYLLLEYTEGGNICGTAFRDEAGLACVVHQVLLGLDYLHRNNIAHGDLRTSNILVNSLNQVKLSYFGKILSGTPPLDDDDGDGGIGGIQERCCWDIWNVGLNILKSYNGPNASLDFRMGDIYELRETINFESGGISLPPGVQEYYSKDFWNFLLCCMQRGVPRRWTISELIRHPFIGHRYRSWVVEEEHFLAASSISHKSSIMFGGAEQNSPNKRLTPSISDISNISSGGAEQNSPNKRPKFHVEDDTSIYHTETTSNPTEGVAHQDPGLTSLQVYNRCIQHCSLFHQGFEFEKDKLVQLWIAEECFDVKAESMEDVAKTYFDILVEKEDILPSTFDNLYGEMKYKVNASKALIWPLIGGEYLRVENDILDEIPKSTLHLSLHHKKFDRTSFDALKDCKQLRTLLVHGDCSSSIEQLPNSLFLHLTRLRTLDLSFSHLSELPSSIGNLESLRYLDVSETPIKRLPESTDRLYFLQTLRLRGCFGVHALPKELRKLINLCHLDIDIVQQLKSMPKGMGILVNLRTLRGFLVGKNDECGITELKSMKNITGSFCISRLENVRNAHEAKEAAMGNKKYIEKLELQWTDHKNENSEAELEILEHLQPHFGLKELQILFYGGTKLPSWINNPSFTELANITLYKCFNCDILPSIGELPSLKFLNIVEMNSIVDINSLFCRNHETQGCNAFPVLEKLTLENMFNLEKWTGLENGDFPCLRHISIRYCPKLFVLPILSHLHALQYLEISHCMELVSLPEGGLPSSLESLIIRECPKINKRCCKDEGQDWFKIAHVRNIWIDFKEISLD